MLLRNLPIYSSPGMSGTRNLSISFLKLFIYFKINVKKCVFIYFGIKKPKYLRISLPGFLALCVKSLIVKSSHLFFTPTVVYK